MKFKIALVVALVAGLTLSLAVAAPAKGPKTNTNTTTTTKGKKPVCKPTVSLILNGKLIAVNDEKSFSMTVTAANKIAKPYKKLGTATVLAPSTTKITLNGKKATLDKLATGDRLSVQARVCKKNIPSGDPTAKRVTAKRPKVHS
jgi:hypothetical protein